MKQCTEQFQKIKVIKNKKQKLSDTYKWKREDKLNTNMG